MAAAFLHRSRRLPASSSPSSESPKRPATSRSSSIRIPAWAFARRVSDHHRHRNAKTQYQDAYYQTHSKLQDSPDSLAKRTIETFPLVAEDDDEESGRDSHLWIPEISQRVAAAAAAATDPTRRVPIQPEPDALSDIDDDDGSRPGDLEGSDPDKVLIMKMDTTGFAAKDLSVTVDIHKKLICLSGMGPRMFKRSFPLPASTSLTPEDMERLEASFVVEDKVAERPSKKESFLLITLPAARTTNNDETREEPEGLDENHRSIASEDSSSTSSSSFESDCGRGFRRLVIQDTTRPPMTIVLHN